MSEEPTLDNALEALMGMLDNEVEKLTTVTRRDQLSTSTVEEADSSLDKPTFEERNTNIDAARQTLRKAMFDWLEAKDIGWRE